MDPIIIPNGEEAARFKEVRGEPEVPVLRPYEPWTAPPVRVHPAGTFAPARCPTCACPAPELVTSPSPSISTITSTSTHHLSTTSLPQPHCPQDICAEAGTSWMVCMAAGAAGALLVLALGTLVGLLLRWVGWLAAGPLVVLSVMTAIYISSKYPQKANQLLSWARGFSTRTADTLRKRLQEVWGRQVNSRKCSDSLTVLS